VIVRRRFASTEFNGVASSYGTASVESRLDSRSDGASPQMLHRSVVDACSRGSATFTTSYGCHTSQIR
jgi:hypothetical protein